MAKKCLSTDCDNPVFSKGYCKYHQWMRTDDKKPKPISTYAIKKPTGEKALFEEIWSERPHISFVSGKPLTKYNNSTYGANMFAHVLAKGQYPKQRLDKRNILLLTPYEHTLIDHGTEQQRLQYQKETPGCDWNKWYEYREILLQTIKLENNG